jgi:Tat protein secretion system quality control protein TatD with DNase activity
VVQKLAEVKGISVEDVAKETTVNEGKIFKEFEYT